MTSATPAATPAAAPAAAPAADAAPPPKPPPHAPPPSHLISELRAGRVIAFVGAGFTASANFPTWKDLLLKTADAAQAEGKLGSSTVELVKQLLSAPRPAAHEFDQAAQVIDDELHVEGAPFQAELVRHLRTFLRPKALPLPAVMERRLQTLRELKFRAILTTNYNPLLRGITPFDARAPSVYRSVLRGGESESGGEKGEGGEGGEGGAGASGAPGVAYSTGDELKYAEAGCPPVIQCHGNLHDASSVVLTHEGYRRLLYACPNYHSFVKACLAQYTVLYVGFSFTDAYLNELNSEVLSMVGCRGPPIAYALLPNKSERERHYFRNHRGMHVLSWSTDEEGYGGLDRILEEIAAAAAGGAVGSGGSGKDAQASGVEPTS